MTLPLHSSAPQEMTLDGKPCREYPQGEIRIFSGFRTRAYVAAQPDKVYVFGDNTADRLVAAPATMTQAVIRGLPNAFGIDTKHHKRKDDPTAFFSPSDLPAFIAYFEHTILELLTLQKQGHTLVFPEGGIGTGAAKLAEKAPKILAHITERLFDTFGYNNEAHSQDPLYTSYYKDIFKNRKKK